MATRRAFIKAAALAGAGGAGAAAWHAFRSARDYDQATARTWRHEETELPRSGLPMRALVRYATLAPSSHNTQCWKFRVADRSVSILPDYQRRCPIVDPDDHHLFVSLGCAAETLVHAAAAMGLRATPVFRADPAEALDISLEPIRAARSVLFEAIPRRQSTRAEYDGRPLTTEELRLLETAGTGSGVQVWLLTDRRVMEEVLDFVVEGNTQQMRDPAFVRELKHWIRFNGSQAATTGDGLYAGASGNPDVPAWLGRLMFDLVFSEATENEKYARHMRSSAGIAVFVSEHDDAAHWLEAGRAFQRFALQATAIGIRTAHVNQPVEVAALRPRFAEAIGMTGGRPDLVIRFGRGPEMPRSPRRPIEAVLV